MTIRFTAEEPGPKSLISGTEQVYEDIAAELFAALGRIREGDLDPKGATHTVRELRQFLNLVLEERARLVKLNKQESGVAHDYALDFDAARAEIGRRLACLRDAGGS